MSIFGDMKIHHPDKLYGDASDGRDTDDPDGLVETSVMDGVGEDAHRTAVAVGAAGSGGAGEHPRGSYNSATARSNASRARAAAAEEARESKQAEACMAAGHLPRYTDPPSLRRPSWTAMSTFGRAAPSRVSCRGTCTYTYTAPHLTWCSSCTALFLATLFAEHHGSGLHTVGTHFNFRVSAEWVFGRRSAEFFYPSASIVTRLFHHSKQFQGQEIHAVKGLPYPKGGGTTEHNDAVILLMEGEGRRFWRGVLTWCFVDSYLEFYFMSHRISLRRAAG